MRLLQAMAAIIYKNISFLFIVLLFNALLQVRGQQSCHLQDDGSMPPAGACTGPMARTQLRRQGFNSTNAGCPIGQVIYYVEGVTSSQPKV